MATWFAAPGGVLFAGFVAYIVLSVLYAIVTLGFGKPVMSRFGNWIDRRAAPAAAAGIVSAGVVVGVSAERRFRRTVVRVLFINGSEVRYTRWGARRAGRDLTEGFRSLMSQTVPSGPRR